MRQFWKNILRLAWKNRGAMAGSALIIAIGIFTMAAMFDTMFNLTGQIQSYYERAELGDIFCTVEGITDAELKRTEEIPGIRKAAGQRPVRYMAAGDRSGCFACLWPDREHPPGDTNEQSLVILFECCGHRCLFTGDAGQESEEKLLAMLKKEQLSGREECIPGPVDVLKAGHHGSAGKPETGQHRVPALCLVPAS